MEIVEIPLDKLTSFEGNPRLRTEKVLGHLVKSVREFGLVDPVIVWANATKYGYPKNCILGGHRRVDALRWLVDNEGMEAPLVPCVPVKVNGVYKAKALNVALNRIGEEFDIPALKDWLVEIDTGDIEGSRSGSPSSAYGRPATRSPGQYPEPCLCTRGPLGNPRPRPVGHPRRLGPQSGLNSRNSRLYNRSNSQLLSFQPSTYIITEGNHLVKINTSTHNKY